MSHGVDAVSCVSRNSDFKHHSNAEQAMRSNPNLWWHFAFRQQLVFLGMFVTFCGPMMGVVVFAIGQNEAQFEKEGASVDGTVISKSQLTKVGKSGGTSYKVSYRYRTADGREFEGEGFIPFKHWDGLTEGGTLSVRYLASDMSRSEPNYPARLRTPTMTYVGFGIAGVLALLGLILLLTSLRTISRRVLLLRTGQRTNAWIKQVIPEAGVLVYQYWDDNGDEHEGREQAPRGIQGAMNIGDQFLVLVDPANPKRHEIDMLGVRANG